MTNVPSVSVKRAQLNIIKADCEKYNLGEAVPTPGIIRSEVLLGPGALNEILFPIRQDQTNNGQPISSTEVRLANNDAFYLTYVAVQYYTLSVAPAAAGTPGSQAGRARARLQQFPNSAVFGLNAPEIEAAQNGTLTITQNNKIFLREAAMKDMEFVGLAEQGVAGAVASSTEWPKGFLDVGDPMIRLNGPSSIEARAIFADAVNATLVANQSVYAVFLGKGWLVQNGGLARTI